jgi:hypothetical protein
MSHPPHFSRRKKWVKNLLGQLFMGVARPCAFKEHHQRAYGTETRQDVNMSSYRIQITHSPVYDPFPALRPKT